jgi:peroxiredoxin Q/BCP
VQIRILSLSALIFGAAACGGSGSTSASAESSGAPAAAPGAASAERPLRPGDPAPALPLKLQDGKEIKLADLKGKYVLVYFYPKDDTPGCTVEAKDIKDHWEKLEAAGIEVYGVSTQDAASHQAFIDKHQLPFPLVVDESGAVAAAFRVPVTNGYAKRQSFLIDKDGSIKQVWLNVQPAEHAEAVLAEANAPDADDD